MIRQILNILNITDYNFNELFNDIIIDLPGEWISSSYDLFFHKFEYPTYVNDNYIKQVISEIYYQH